MKENFGLIGEKLGHSISPQIHNYIFEHCGIDGSYELYEIKRENLHNFIQLFKEKSIKGLNVTIPYKIEVMQYLDNISKEAKNIGAVNTILFNGGKLSGYNTDYYGIQQTFQRYNISLKGRHAVILGSGGAATAVLQYLKDSDCKDVTFVVRDKESAKRNPLFQENNIINYDELTIVSKKEILINCTPVGMFPNIEKCPVPDAFIEGFDFIFDLIYNPIKTKLLQCADNYGIVNCNGLYMLVGQAVYAESIWNDIEVRQGLIEELFAKLTNKEHQ